MAKLSDDEIDILKAKGVLVMIGISVILFWSTCTDIALLTYVLAFVLLPPGIRYYAACMGKAGCRKEAKRLEGLASIWGMKLYRILLVLAVVYLVALCIIYALYFSLNLF